MTNRYIKTEIKGYKVEIYKGYNGDEVFISKDGNRVYSARVHKNEGLERAVEKIAFSSAKLP